MAWNLHAIEQMQLWGRRVGGVGRPKFDSTQVAAEKIPGSVPILAKLGFAGDYAGTMPGNPLPSTMDLSMVF